MEDQLILFDTAVLADSKGFTERVDWLYFKYTPNKAVKISNVNAKVEKFKSYSAPTQSLLQKWLRETHKLIVLSVYYMELRYIQIGKYYEPQFKIKDGEWTNFEKKKIAHTLQQIASSLARVGTGESWPSITYNNNDVIVFRTEMTCMAFLGAAKVQLNPIVKEFKL